MCRKLLSCSMSIPLESVGSMSRSRHLNLAVICFSIGSIVLGMATNMSSVQSRIAIEEE